MRQTDRRSDGRTAGRALAAASNNYCLVLSGRALAAASNNYCLVLSGRALAAASNSYCLVLSGRALAAASNNHCLVLSAVSPPIGSLGYINNVRAKGMWQPTVVR